MTRLPSFTAMAKYYAEPGTAIQAPYGDSGETRILEWDDTGVIEVPDDDAALVDFLARFADSPSHDVTSQPPEPERSQGETRKARTGPKESS